jgi:hypothetical protein
MLFGQIGCTIHISGWYDSLRRLSVNSTAAHPHPISVYIAAISPFFFYRLCHWVASCFQFQSRTSVYPPQQTKKFALPLYSILLRNSNNTYSIIQINISINSILTIPTKCLTKLWYTLHRSTTLWERAKLLIYIRHKWHLQIKRKFHPKLELIEFHKKK